MIWYNAKLKNKLVVKCTVHALLGIQVGVLEHFRAMGLNSLVTMTGEYDPNLVTEFYANMFFKFDPCKIDISTTVK